MSAEQPLKSANALSPVERLDLAEAMHGGLGARRGPPDHDADSAEHATRIPTMGSE